MARQSGTPRQGTWQTHLVTYAYDTQGEPFIEQVHATMAVLERLASGHDVADFENRYRCKDGSYRWLLWNAAPDSPGHVIYSVARDITERKRAEEAVRASEEQYRAVFNASTDALVLRDAEFRIVDVNPAYEAMSGYARDEVIGLDRVVANPPEIEGEMRTVLSVVKMRGSEHSHEFRSYDITANGGYLTKHSFGVYGTEPPTHEFRWEDVQEAVDREPTTDPTRDRTLSVDGIERTEDNAGAAVVTGSHAAPSVRFVREPAVGGDLEGIGQRPHPGAGRVLDRQLDGLLVFLELDALGRGRQPRQRGGDVAGGGHGAIVAAGAGRAKPRARTPA